jgi:magnesium transporter
MKVIQLADFLREKTNAVVVENLTVILTKSILCSFQERKGDVYKPVRERIRKQKKE